MSQMHSPPVWSMGKGQRSTDLNTTGPNPGPGAYNSVDVRRRSSPGWRIGKAERSAEARSETPGPGNYDVDKSYKGGPKCVLIGKRKTAERSETPGPGAYANSTILRSTDPKPPAFSMRGRSTHNTDETATPGPGTYDQSSRLLHQRPAAVGMGTSKRDDIYGITSTPGPGQYLSRPAGTLEQKSGPKWGFGSAERCEIPNTSKTVVGPGAYKLNSSFDEKKHGAIMISRRPDSAIFNAAKVPGPGAYAPGLFAKTRAPSFRIGTAPRSVISKEQINVPGPGQYSISPEKRGTNVPIASSLRKPLNEKIDTPGPGAYVYRLSTNNGPKYGMIPRRDEVLKVQKDRETPGPGAYEPSVDSIKNKNPKYGIGSGTKDGLYKTTEGPGPGLYDTRGRLSGPKYGFGTDKRNKSMNCSFEKVPGPGAYNVPPKFADAPRYALGDTKLKISL